MTGIIILIVLIIAFVVIHAITKDSVIKLPVLYAGSPNDAVNVKDIPLPKNEPIYKDRGETVSLKGYTPYVISGHSLEPLGINNGSIAYVKVLERDDIKNGNLNDLINRYIVLNIDYKRTQKEHPLKSLPVTSGKKARKVVNIVPTKLSKEEITKSLENLLSCDKEYNSKDERDKQSYLSKLIDKYEFATKYYEQNNQLIISVTYKEGKEKDYSFHSPDWLYGIIEYTSK